MTHRVSPTPCLFAEVLVLEPVETFQSELEALAILDCARGAVHCLCVVGDRVNEELEQHTWCPVVASPPCHRRGKVATSALPGDGEARDIDAERRRLLSQPLGSQTTVLDRGRVPGLGREPVVNCSHQCRDLATRTRGIVRRAFPGTEIAAELGRHLGYPVWADNESNCGALAEWMWGAGQTAKSMAYLKLHSGIGGGLVMGGRLVRGFSGTAGEFGHIIIDRAGPLCRCGRRGCLEAYVGIPAIISQFQPRYGSDFTVGDLARLVADGDPGCDMGLTDAAELIGQALSAVHTIFNPERVVIGGALTGIAPGLVDKILASFRNTAGLCRTGAVVRYRAWLRARSA